jgi:hypothetical protein
MARTSAAVLVSTGVTAALLPWRLTVAATQTTLQLGTLVSPDGPIRRSGGYADLVLRVIGERGYAEQLVELLTDEDGPMRLATVVNELTAPDRPLGRMLSRDGVLDRLLAPDGPLTRLLARDGVLDRLLAEDGPLDRLLGEGGALDRVVAEEGVLEQLLKSGGPVDRLTQPGGLLELVLRPGGLADRMLQDDGFVERLLADGGTLDQLVALGDTLEAIQPRLAELTQIVPTLSSSADALHKAVGPLGDLAGRLPLNRRRASLPAPAGSQA